MGNVILKTSFYSLCFGLAAVLVTSGCAMGHCYGRKPSADEKHITVYKPDGAKQCSKIPGQTLESMAAELHDIKIFSKENKSDGKMHMALCGAASGHVNAYEISEKDLEKAMTLGFEVMKPKEDGKPSDH